jgi:hypothetical protein
LARRLSSPTLLSEASLILNLLVENPRALLKLNRQDKMVSQPCLRCPEVGSLIKKMVRGLIEVLRDRGKQFERITVN